MRNTRLPTVYFSGHHLVSVLVGGRSLREILGSESFARWLVSLALALVLALALALALELALELELALALALELELELALVLELALDLEHYHITASVNNLTCPLPPHQSVIWLAHCHHIISQW